MKNVNDFGDKFQFKGNIHQTYFFISIGNSALKEHRDGVRATARVARWFFDSLIIC